MFKSTYNILKKYDEDEVFDDNWMDTDTAYIPPRIDWDYKREMQIEDVDLWEVIFEGTGGQGVYAAHMPYAEFYLLTTGIDPRYGPRYYETDIPYWDRTFETFYGQGAQQKLLARARQLNIPLSLHTTWVDDDELWLYQNPPSSSGKIIL